MDLRGVNYAAADSVRLMEDRINHLGMEMGMGDGVTQEHMHEMLRKMAEFEDLGKACRWLGYMQGVLVGFNVITLNEAKEINRKYSTE